MRVMKYVGIFCAFAALLTLSGLVALPAAAMPNCSDCNCNTPCSLSCWDGVHVSACWSGPTCKEICEFEWLTTPEQEGHSLDAFLSELAGQTEGAVAEEAPAAE